MFVYFLSMVIFSWELTAKIKKKKKAQNELGILFAIQTHLLNGWICFESTNFVSSKKKVGLAKAICCSLQWVLCDPPYQSAVCLMNLFLVRSVKWQARYIFWLDSWFSKLENRCWSLETWFLKVSRFKNRVSRIKMRVSVNLLLSSTVCYSFMLLVLSHFHLKNFIYYNTLFIIKMLGHITHHFGWLN